MSDAGGDFDFLVGGVSQGKILPPLGTLRLTGKSGFGDDVIKVKKVGQTVVRGVDVDQFESCQKLNIRGQWVTFKVTHYFSATNRSWSLPVNNVVPIAIKLGGVDSTTNQNTTHFFSFFNVKLSLDPLNLETPPGVICVRSNPVPFPTCPKYFRFAAEIVDQVNYGVTYVEEMFSTVDKFAVMSILPQSTTEAGLKTQVDILQDFNLGLSFEIDRGSGRCAISNISESNKHLPLPFSRTDEKGVVHQLTPEQFFSADSTTFHYLGERLVRNVPCDTFITRTSLVTDPTNIVTLEWYFAKDVHTYNDNTDQEKNLKIRIPMKLRKWLDDTSQLSQDTHIYDFDLSHLSLDLFRVENCFPGADSSEFKVSLPGVTPAVIRRKFSQFKGLSLVSLARAARVVLWRVVDLTFDLQKSDVIMSFRLLGAPPHAGDVVESSSPPLSLSSATKNLLWALNNGFVLKAYDPKTKSFSLPLSVKVISQR